MYSQLIDEFIRQEALPESYREDAKRFILPLASELSALAATAGDTQLIGINGAQGTGKSTLSLLLSRCWQAEGIRVANLSIDDFYLSAAARRELAERTQPLLRTRGVPGTHDTDLLHATLDALRRAGPEDSIAMPQFDKAADDVVPRTDWPEIPGPVDVILLEGWFIGVGPQSEAELAEPVNALEAEEDPGGQWRHWVNTRLTRDYQDIFAELRRLILLKAPSFEQVYSWRSLQEEKLRRRAGTDAPGLMDDEQIRRFIQHFERLTRHCLKTLPARADAVIEMDADHRLTALHSRSDPS